MILDFIKDFLRGPEGEFQKLTPDYFLQQRAKLGTEEYARWLKKQSVYYGTMVYMQQDEKLPIPPNWIEGIRLIESEIEKMKTQGASHLFPSSTRK